MVKIVGLQNAASHIRGITGPQAVDILGRAVFVAANRIQTSAQHSITEGAVSGKGHVPSLPGDPPMADTHTLDRQIETEMVEPLKAQVTSNAPYGAFLEFGTSKMAARPYMMPAAERERQAVAEIVGKAVSVVVKRSSITGGTDAEG